MGRKRKYHTPEEKKEAHRKQSRKDMARYRAEDAEMEKLYESNEKKIRELEKLADKLEKELKAPPKTLEKAPPKTLENDEKKFHRHDKGPDGGSSRPSWSGQAFFITPAPVLTNETNNATSAIRPQTPKAAPLSLSKNIKENQKAARMHKI